MIPEGWDPGGSLTNPKLLGMPIPIPPVWGRHSRLPEFPNSRIPGQCSGRWIPSPRRSAHPRPCSSRNSSPCSRISRDWVRSSRIGISQGFLPFPAPAAPLEPNPCFFFPRILGRDVRQIPRVGLVGWDFGEALPVPDGRIMESWNSQGFGREGWVGSGLSQCPSPGS